MIIQRKLGRKQAGATRFKKQAARAAMVNSVLKAVCLSQPPRTIKLYRPLLMKMWEGPTKFEARG